MTGAWREATCRTPDGLELYYRDYPAQTAAGPPVICLPGLTRNSRDFEELALRLAAHHRVLSPDLRGRGRSQWDPEWRNYQPRTYVGDVIAVLDAASVPRIVVIGTSLGGIIAMGLALTVPHRLIAVVINDIGPEVDPRGIARIRGYAGKLPPVNTWAEAAAQVQATHAAAMPDLTEEQWLAYCRRSFREGPDGRPVPDMDPRIGDAIRDGPATPPALWSAFEALRPIPTLAIRGARSDLLSAEVFARMKELKPDLVQVEIANRGHAPLLDEPASLAALDAFLAALPHER
jgi:pimeloyl-ACP methyl ester carboxylesterase